MASRKKTWVEKRQVQHEPKIEVLDKAFGGMEPGQRMLVSTAAELDAYIKQIPEGTAVDFATLKKDLAIAHGADGCCPLTAGIFLRIVAEAAYEEYQQGKKLADVTPFWRVISTSSPTAKKLTFGTELLQQQRQKEGLSI